MSNDYGRETQDGRTLVRSDRTEQVNVKLRADLERLLKSLGAHHRRYLNDVVVLALKELDRRGLSNQPYLRNLADGLRKPKRILSCTLKISPAELELLDRLAQRFGVSRARIMAAALIELDRDDPVELMGSPEPRRGSGGTGAAPAAEPHV